MNAVKSLVPSMKNTVAFDWGDGGLFRIILVFKKETGTRHTKPTH